MRIYEGTGVLSAVCTAVSKSVGTMILKTSRHPLDFINQKITIEIERVGGSNVAIATNVGLAAFIYNNINASGNLIHAVGGYHQVVLSLGVEQGIKLGDGEKLLIKLSSILATDAFVIDVVEEVVNGIDYFAYEQKSLLVGEVDQSYNVQDYEYVTFRTDGIDEIGISTTFSAEKRFTVDELQALMLEDRPLLGYTVDGTVDIYDNKSLTLPLGSVLALRFYKDASQVTVMTFMKLAELIPANAKPRFINASKASKFI